MDRRDGAEHIGWVERRLATLDPGDPPVDVETPLARFRRARTTAGHNRRRQRWAVALIAAVGLGLLSTPDTRDFAARCIDACVVVTNRLGRMVRSSPPEAAPPAATHPTPQQPPAQRRGIE